jgi:phenylalanyl-tRNA synthetase beta chain
MLVPLTWLKKYVPVTIPPRELAHRLTMAGTEVGAVEEIGADWDRDKVLVGRVLKVDRHPNADRLTLPTVDLGDGETATVVCGAPNVAAEQKIAFAREGARLINPRSKQVEELKATKIRGVLSAGMVCSELELGLGEDHEGILVLDEGAPVGMPLVDYLGDAVLDLDVTPNRPDCLSILGVAHEVAAVTGEGVTEPDPAYPEEGPPIEERVKIEISDPKLCPRYTASLVTGLTVGPSPGWLQAALSRAGMRPINNVVDVTNYVMLEYGQPLHAFDFDTIGGGTVIIRKARGGESLATLDDETRKLGPPMLTIADDKNAIALAGVIGGANTGVRDATTSVLVESANFDATNTRRTASALRLSTEASYRFERGIRAELAPLALRRATQLILEVAGGEAASGIVDLYPGRKQPPAVKISRARLKQLLGVDFKMSKVEGVLGSLGFRRSEPEEVASAIKSEKDVMWMEAPYWRSDIAIEDDLVEEVARTIGYDSIPTTMLSTPIPHHEPRPLRDLRERLRDLFAASGMREVISYPLTSRDSAGDLEAAPGDSEPLKVANPMSSEKQYLRTSLRGSVLETLASNRRVSRSEGIRLFEIGRVYLPREEAKDRDLPDEKEMVAGVLSGPRLPVSWVAHQGDMGFFDAKGVLETVLEQIGVSAVYEPAGDASMHPGKTARLVCGGRVIGTVGEVSLTVLKGFGLGEGPVAMFEIDLESLYEVVPDATVRYASRSRFPESERDLALVVDDTVPASTIQSIIDRHKLVIDSSPISVYTGEGVQAGKKSIAFRTVFQSSVSTLTAEQVDRAQDDILRQLEREVGAELRA